MGRINTTYFIYLYFPRIDISGLDNIHIEIEILGGFSFTPVSYTYNTSGSFITTETPVVRVMENRTPDIYLHVVSLSALYSNFDPSLHSWHIWLDFTRLTASKTDGQPVYTSDIQSIQSDISMENSGGYTYYENIMNGLPMVRTNNTGLTKTGGILTDDPIMVVAAVYISQSATYCRLISWGYSINEAWDVYAEFSGALVRFIFVTDTATAGSGPTITSDWFSYPQGFVLAAWQEDDETMHFRIMDESGNEYDYPVITGRGGGFSNFRLFDIYYPSYNWGFNNYVGEIIVHNDIYMVEDVFHYMAFKWVPGLTGRVRINRLWENLYKPELYTSLNSVVLITGSTSFTGSIINNDPIILTSINNIDTLQWNPQFTGSIVNNNPIILTPVNNIDTLQWNPQFTGSIVNNNPVLLTTISNVLLLMFN
ncbi:hypothetical protein Rm378p078 [Rhodothermus phage RM378]|uniref:hypothetical protein n=1 Tax=Rhodothermus phage RM378 TaxID=148943 RepID=UPI00000381E3|nr:hypothetical protein Rm378p078 [Rhodothermus phage RM378]